MSKLNFHQYIKTAKPKKKDRDFCTRSASAQFHPGLTEVTQRSFCFSQTFLVLLNMRNSIERICLEIQDLQKKENDEDFHPATKQKRLRRRLRESFSSRYFKSQKCIISLPEKLQRKSLQLYSPKKILILLTLLFQCSSKAFSSSQVSRG